MNDPYSPIHEWFDSVAKRYPNHVAIEYGSFQLTYEQLRLASNAISASLYQRGVLKSDVVCIFTGSEIERIKCVIGILKAGCAFLSMHPSSANSQLRSLLDLSDPRFIIVEDEQSERLLDLTDGEREDEGRMITFSHLQVSGARAERIKSDPDDLAYLFFTSGSTGMPKAIAGRLKAIDHFIRWEIQELNVAEGTRVSQLTNCAFDAWLRDVFVALCSGGTLCIPENRDTLLDGEMLVEWIESHSINVVHTIPSLFRTILPHIDRTGLFEELRQVLLSGESLLGVDVDKWKQRFGSQIELFNLYGPSETTMVKCFYRTCDEDRQRVVVPIGKPMSGAEILLLDDNRGLCSPGDVGEIYIRTAYRSLGYYQNQELTDEHFIPDPFIAGDEGRLYRTGDLGGFLPDGNLEFRGRRDDQVKIRGHRIELAEVEDALLRYPSVEQCAVIAREFDDSDKRLVAYVVTAGADGLARASELRHHLAEGFPDYMVPGHIVFVDSLPTTSSGKVDRQALIKMKKIETEETIPLAPPCSLEEELVISIWEHLLKVQNLTRDANFFHVGGHSLLATRLASRLRRAFGISFSLKTIFAHPVLSDLVKEMTRLRRRGEQHFDLPISRRCVRGDAPLSFPQQRLWFLTRLHQQSSAYNSPLALRLSGELDIEALESGIRSMIKRHDILRTRIDETDGEPRQLVDDHVSNSIAWVDLQELDNSQDIADALIRDEAKKPFDLIHGPLVRVYGLKLGAKEHLLLLTLHHIVTDGWSATIIYRELSSVYEAKHRGIDNPLEDLPIQYADFAFWQRNSLTSGLLDDQLKYWRDQLRDIEPLQLPTDYERPLVASHTGERIPISLPDDLTTSLRRFAREQGVTLYIVLLAAWGLFLCRSANQKNIVVGTPVANRNREELEPLIGCFINTLLMRIDISGRPTFEQLLERVRGTVLDAYSHQDLAFERLVEVLAPVRDLSREPLVQAMLILQPPMDSRLTLAEVEITEVNTTQHWSGYDIVLALTETAGMVGGTLSYAVDLFTLKTAKTMADRFLVLLEDIVASPAKTVCDLAMLSARDKIALLARRGPESTGSAHLRPAHILIEARAKSLSQQIAVEDDQGCLSYGDLITKSSVLANRLAQLSVTPGSVVAMCLDRSHRVLISVLAILRSGAAYLPLDPEYPLERTSFMLSDASPTVVLTERKFAERFSLGNASVVCVDDDLSSAGSYGDEVKTFTTHPLSAAYILYTSGTSGRPKGVTVSHANLSNFLHAMDEAIDHSPGGTWLALTNVTFDISILELLWTLTQGFRIILGNPRTLFDTNFRSRQERQSPLDFSLFYFAAKDHGGVDRYRLLLDGTRFADKNGFRAVWTPERHFHSFGGLYPNPAVTGAALGAITEKVDIRAGSVVAPLHNPLRIAEEWSVIDNLTQGRVGISFAPGWHVNDFVLAPSSYEDRKAEMMRDIETVKTLWRGRAVLLPNGKNVETAVTIHPRPVQTELPVWITTSGNPESFKAAAVIGANVLTHLLGQSVDDVAKKIQLYRETWRQHNHVGEGCVTIMVHAFVGRDEAHVRETVEVPFSDYLLESTDLVAQMAKSFDRETELSQYDAVDRSFFVRHAFDRYVGSSGLMGTIEGCLATAEKLASAGVDEIACLVDFGISYEDVMESLARLGEVKSRFHAKQEGTRAWFSSDVSHMQCTPSVAGLLIESAAFQRSFKGLKYLFIGGEALPVGTAKSLKSMTSAKLFNMYGPTETTIWSTMHELSGIETKSIPIGSPIANTQLYVVDEDANLVPAGVVGELYVGGEGVALGYRNSPELTAERFIPDPFAGKPGSRLYRTGDLVRWHDDQRLEYLGRVDLQVKLRGFRVELGEIEAAIRNCPGVRNGVVLPKTGIDGLYESLIAYYVTTRSTDPAEIRSFLQSLLPAHMIPSTFIELDSLPLTSSGKIDRKALPVAVEPAKVSINFEAPQGNTEVLIADVWQDLLKVERVGREDNFFALGGHSLLGLKVIEQMRRAGLGVNLKSLFVSKDLADLARIVDSSVDTEGGNATGIARYALSPLSKEQLEWIAARVPGGRQNIEDVYPLFSLQEGELAHHLMDESGDIYLHRVQIRFTNRPSLDAYLSAMEKVVQRHDVLRTAVFWEGLPEPVQVVLRKVNLPVEEVGLDLGTSDVGAALRAHCDPRHYRFDLRDAPLLRVFIAPDQRSGDWYGVLLCHHIAIEGPGLIRLQDEVLMYLDGDSSALREPLPYREIVAQALAGSKADHYTDYFRKRLGSVSKPCAPYGVVDLRNIGVNRIEDSRMLDRTLTQSIRGVARKFGVSAASIFHVGWAVTLGYLCNSNDVVFGTVITTEPHLRGAFTTTLGPTINTLPARIQLEGESALHMVRATHEDLAELLLYRHASLIVAQRCSGVPVTLPLFTTLFNFRHIITNRFEGVERTSRHGIEIRAAEEQTSYPFNCSVDDTGEGFIVSVQSIERNDPQLINNLFVEALVHVTNALANEPTLPLPRFNVDRSDASQALQMPIDDALVLGTRLDPPTTLIDDLGSIWKLVLGIDKIEPTGNFFELGGHSLLAIRALSRIRGLLEVDVNFNDFFDYPVLSDFAREMSQRGKVRPQVIRKHLPGEPEVMSFAQERMWFLANIENATAAYNVNFGFQICGPLDQIALERAMQQLLKQHEVLRATFSEGADGLRPKTIPVDQLGDILTYHDLRTNPEAYSELERLRNVATTTPFDLESGPLIRALLARVTGVDHILVFAVHHIIFDGWSLGIFLRDLGILYKVATQRTLSMSSADSLQYADYAIWQRSQITGALLNDQSRFWITTLTQIPKLMGLPTDRPRPAQQDYRGQFVAFDLDETDTATVKALCQRHGVTPFMIVLAAWAALLSRLSEDSTVVIGIPVANRGHAELEEMIGLFTNTLAIRIDIGSSTTVNDLIHGTTSQVLAAQTNQDIPFEYVVDAVNPERDLSHTPIFQVMFAWQEEPVVDLGLNGLEVTGLGSSLHTYSKFDLTLFMSEGEGHIRGGMEYAAALFNEETIRLHLGYLKSILRAMKVEGARLGSALTLAQNTDWAEVMHKDGNVRAAGVAPRVDELFASQVARTPHAVAFADATEVVSYSQLERRTDTLAGHLLRLGAQPNDRIILWGDYGAELLVAMIAIAKVSGTYIFVDPSKGMEWIQKVVDQSHASLILASSSAARLTGLEESVIIVDLAKMLLAYSDTCVAHETRIVPKENHHLIAYINFIASANGEPLGIFLDHRALSQAVTSHAESYLQELGGEAKFRLGKSVDSSGMDVWVPLCLGLTICLHAVAQDTANECTGEEGASERPELRVVTNDEIPGILSGLLSPRHRVLLRTSWNDSCQLVYHPEIVPVIRDFRPAETCLPVAFGQVSGCGESIGTPIVGTTLYVLDEDLEIVPNGVPGSLYVGGTGTFQGILNDFKSTANRLLPDPFSNIPGARMFKTEMRVYRDGDKLIVRETARPSGADTSNAPINVSTVNSRVKEIRGVIDAETVVNGEGNLEMYVVQDGDLTAHELGHSVRNRLPRHLIPPEIEFVEIIPRNQAGIADWALLQKRSRSRSPNVKDLGEIVNTLATIWEDILEVSRVGVTDNFFGLGGHSLLATQLVARIRRTFGIDITLRTIFELPVLKDLARAVHEMVHSTRRYLPIQSFADEPLDPKAIALIEDMSALPDADIEVLLSKGSSDS
jgi:natural product biosynthesis luciferase-like monooxygenase protein/amino acid adenylation domain-containing protein